MLAANFLSLSGNAAIEAAISSLSSPQTASKADIGLPNCAPFAHASRNSVAVLKGPPSPWRRPMSYVPSSSRMIDPILGKVMEEISV